VGGGLVAAQGLAIQICEWDVATGALLETTPARLPSAIAPHDFVITENYYVFVLNGMELKLAPYVLGLCGPVGALLTTGEGVTLKLVPRPGSTAAKLGRKPLTVRTQDPYFAIHHANGLEELAVGGGAGEVPMIRLYTAAWPKVGAGPFLGDWGGAVPLYDDGKIAPTQLLQTTIRLFEEGASVERVVAVEACIDHPHVDPRFEGDHRCRYLYMSYCNDGAPSGSSGSPPIGWMRWDRQTGEQLVWKAPPRTFCEEVVVIPRPTAADEDAAVADAADCWIAGMMYDADRDASCLAILNGDDIEAGPVCRLWLSSAVPHGLHGCFSPGAVFGLD